MNNRYEWLMGGLGRGRALSPVALLPAQHALLGAAQLPSGTASAGLNPLGEAGFPSQPISFETGTLEHSG